LWPLFRELNRGQVVVPVGWESGIFRSPSTTTAPFSEGQFKLRLNRHLYQYERAGGRAVVCNATNPAACTAEPFTVTTNDGSGTQAPRLASVADRRETTLPAPPRRSVRAVNSSSNTASDLPGTDLVTFVLPATVDIGDLPIALRQ
jgi:hypothetical protein